MSDKIRSLFSSVRPLDRTIEKVIDYYAADEERLAAEIEEYEITENVEECFRKFLDVYEEGVQRGRVTEIGVWVSGFYGSGKSSFTKYLGFALDAKRKIKGRPFLDFLCDRFTGPQIPAQLRTLATRHPAAVVFLDLGTDSLTGNPRRPVSEVLYYKALQWAGYPTNEKKLSHLMFTLERHGRLGAFEEEYRKQYGADWRTVQDDPLLGISRASKILPVVWPEEYPDPKDFQSVKFEENRTVRQLAQDMIDLIRRKARTENILFLVDESGQYVAPSGHFILDFDGFSRCLKEIGQGKVWLVATGQQTLAEIVEKAAHNSAELNRMKDRFPISIHLDARDIREITYRRLLTKSGEGERRLKAMFASGGPALCAHTRLESTRLFRGDPDTETFARLYPFLPQHFDILLELIRTLARSTGGIGLRSAIRVIQDVLVDKSRVLPPGAERLADRGVNRLACADDFFDTLRADISKVLPFAVEGVDKVVRAFPDRPLHHRVAKAVAALQPLEGFPKTAENIAALLCQGFGASSLTEDVRTVLKEISSAKECGLIEDPAAGGFVFLSDKSKDERERRNVYVPTTGECRRHLIDLLRDGVAGRPLFSIQPSARLLGSKDVRAEVKLDKVSVTGSGGDLDLRVEMVDPDRWDARRAELLIETNAKPELKNAVVLLARRDSAQDDLLAEIARSAKYLGDTFEAEADHDVAQYIRAERRALERNRESLAKSLEDSLLQGVTVFRGAPKPVREQGATLEAALRQAVAEAAGTIFDQYHLAHIRPKTDLSAQFLLVENLKRVNTEVDPLHLVVQRGGQYRVDSGSPVLVEAMRVFEEKVREVGTGRLQGNTIQDLFAGPPYGWTKDTVRYLFSALLRAGEVEFFIAGVEGAVRTPLPQAVEAVKSTVNFNRIGVGRRGERIPIDALDRAARRLEELCGEEVLPDEEFISRAVRKHLPGVLEEIGSLADRLRLLGLRGCERAQRIAQETADLIKGDASGAAALLGAAECSIPSDLRWSRGVAKALDEGGEGEVRTAQTLLSDLARTSRLFPEEVQGLIPEEHRRAIDEILDSEVWHERLPNLRTFLGGLRESSIAAFRVRRASYSEALQRTVEELEAEPNWPLLPEEDRDSILNRLDPRVSAEPDAASPISSLDQVLTLAAAVPGLRDFVVTRVRSFRPPEPEARPKPERGPEPGETVVDRGTLLTPAEIADDADLEQFLNSLRSRLKELLGRSKKVVIR